MLVGESGAATHPGPRVHNDDVALTDDSTGAWAIVSEVVAKGRSQPWVDEALARTPWAGRAAGEGVILFDRTLASISRASPDPVAAAITAATLFDDVVEVANLGDVLAVHIHDEPHLVSNPQTLFREHVKMGLESIDRHASYSRHGHLTRYAGQGRGDPAIEEIPVDPGDTIILCSRGVCADLDRGPLTLHDLKNLTAGRHPRDAASALVQEALSRGTDANATAIVIQIEEL